MVDKAAVSLWVKVVVVDDDSNGTPIEDDEKEDPRERGRESSLAGCGGEASGDRGEARLGDTAAAADEPDIFSRLVLSRAKLVGARK